MIIELSSRFENRAQAERALMRLRQNSVSYRVSSISSAAGISFEVPAFTSAGHLGTVASRSGMLSPSVSSELTDGIQRSGHVYGEVLRLRLGSDQLESARRVLEGAQAKNIHVIG